MQLEDCDENYDATHPSSLLSVSFDLAGDK
jgi:hypothetical protein